MADSFGKGLSVLNDARSEGAFGMLVGLQDRESTTHLTTGPADTER